MKRTLVRLEVRRIFCNTDINIVNTLNDYFASVFTKEYTNHCTIRHQRLYLGDKHLETDATLMIFKRPMKGQSYIGN